MELYSDEYRYHGLSNDEIRKIWDAMVQRYGDLTSTHMFSRIHVVSSGIQPTAEITCTGSLWGLSKETGQRVIIDSWFNEVHHVVREQGTWRLRGHEGEEIQVLPFGASPHPFF